MLLLNVLFYVTLSVLILYNKMDMESNAFTQIFKRPHNTEIRILAIVILFVHAEQIQQKEAALGLYNYSRGGYFKVTNRRVKFAIYTMKF